ncbi:MAG: 4Fe-4S binding protein [Thermodesulfovibrio sp.]|nr:4Fe-4S binding protein [Thermodesulfovibrio sp.]
MPIRPIIYIDEEKCDGCGICVNACAEGAIKIVNGKAKLINEIFCDGLGACLGSCPKGAITIVEREAKPFNEEVTKHHLQLLKKLEPPPCECLASAKNHKLNNWPIQLRLVSINAPFLKDSDIVIAADCTAFSYKEFHENILKDRKLLIACPKLDDVNLYLEKLTEIFKLNNVKSVLVLRMTVPCCGGLSWIVQESMKRAKKKILFEEKVIDIDGTIKN